MLEACVTGRSVNVNVALTSSIINTEIILNMNCAGDSSIVKHLDILIRNNHRVREKC